MIRTLDQVLFPLAKLQDAMGLRLVPVTLALHGEPMENKPMLDKLNRLEELDLPPSVEHWQVF